MAIIGQGATALKTTAAPKAAAPPPQAAPAARAGFPQSARSFEEARPRSNNKLFLEAIGVGQSAVYTIRVNRVVQKWANPKAVNDMFPQPTKEELATAQPAFGKKDCYIIECDIVESTNPACPPGYGPPSIVLTDKYPDSYMGDIRGFIAAAAGVPIEQVTLEDWQLSYQQSQPLAGLLVKVTVTAQKNKTNDGTFTRHLFNVSPAQHPAAE